ncbi:MAG: dicarboxylate/amino acid:cation symporter [Candidatus Sericytochromatia bacterium]|nr:dicarboxylate/amino acid:cation symporter [Candidatus Tanganyikabacteria bacterium]
MALYTRILIGMVLGAGLGVLAQIAAGAPAVSASVSFLNTQVMDPAGKLFIQAIKFVVVPLVVSSLVLGIASLGDIRKIGRVGGKTMLYYAGTLTAAVLIALAVGLTTKPGGGLSPELKQSLLDTFKPALDAKVAAAGQAAAAPKSLGDFLLAMLPANPLAAAVAGDMLPIIVASLLFGLALATLDAGRARPVLAVCEGVYDAMLKIVGVIMEVAPFAVFALLFSVTSRLGWDIFAALLQFTAVCLLAFALQAALVYLPAIRILSGWNIADYIRRTLPVLETAFSTSSSNATLPLSLKAAEEDLGVPREIAGFTIPLGATVNMDGTAIYIVLTGLFVAQIMVPDPLTAGQLGMLGVMAGLAAIGAAGIPGGSIPLMAGVFGSVGIPPAGIALVLGMDRLLDMCRTTLNVYGDLTCATFVARSERRLQSPAMATTPDASAGVTHP